MINWGNHKWGRKVASFVIAGGISVIYSSGVYAHAQFKIDSVTPPRYNTDGIKTSPPCGADASFATLRTNRKGIFISGETITVEWIETINHGGSYVFDFAPANDQGFENNFIMSVPDTQNDSSSRANPHYYSQAIQLNYPPCEACTLRMRQDMENAQNFYYSCADIVLVSGNDFTPPQEVTGASTSLVANGVQLDWINPVDAEGIIVLRNTAAISGQPATREDYLVGDTIGNSEVVYKGAGESFTDSNVTAATEYTYQVFAYDADYNYNSGISQTITTGVEADPPEDPGTVPEEPGQSVPGEPQQMNDPSSGGGAGSWALILLATLLIFQRPAWKKLW